MSWFSETTNPPSQKKGEENEESEGEREALHILDFFRARSSPRHIYLINRRRSWMPNSTVSRYHIALPLRQPWRKGVEELLVGIFIVVIATMRVAVGLLIFHLLLFVLLSGVRAVGFQLQA